MKIQEPARNTIGQAIKARAYATPGKPEFDRVFSRALSKAQNGKNQPPPVDLGRITQKTPTVSQLLYNSPLKEKCWNIIYDKINSDKAFHKIRPGTQVMFDPASGELLWGKELTAFMAQNETAPEKKAWQRQAKTDLPEFDPDNQPAQLSRAVKNFIGQDYEGMDCYELLVGGLKELGVQYQGKGGLGRHLMNQALEKGLPQNHYLNGEGLVSESGNSVFKKTIFKVTNPSTQAADLMKDMSSLLAEGQVLSFSMRNKGHTGVISRQKEQWTFINSGDMDHNISGENGSKKVGEEDLKSELENWFRLAGKTRQGLKITLGTLNMDQLSMYRPKRFSRKV